ncbi:hypothetical protein GQ600_13733 [Phytophthora cactorum]|nr:hypothetical protein GQ600_13733 [Phytophthora cactorum]
MSSMSASSDICGIDVQALYLNDPGNKQEPVGCRSAANAEVNGTTKYFGVCVVLQKGKDCVTSGDDYLTCAVSSETSDSVTESQNESSVTRSSTNTKATTESNATPSASTNASSSGAGNTVTVKSTAVSSDSMSTTVMVVIIVVAVVFVALVSWVIRSYCMRRSSAKGKLASNRNRSHHSTNFEATSPTNMTGRSSATPSFPAFDRRTRAMQSPTTTSGRSAGRSGRNTPRSRETNSSRGRNTPRSRETNSSRGRRNQDIDAQFAPGGPRTSPASRRLAVDGRTRTMTHRSHRSVALDFAPNGPRGIREPGREPTSGRGRRDNGYQADAAMRTPPKQPSRPAPTNGPQPSGGTVYTGRNTYERVAQFAQLAAFEAPPPPPPRPQKAIKPVPVSDPVPKIARAPPPARPAPKRPAFHIPDDPLPTDYDILSPKTARSLAPSVASSATTVVAPGRNRPTPLQQNRRPQYPSAVPSYYQSGYSRDDNKYAESTGFDDSRFDESKYDESNYGDSRYDESSYESKKFKSTNNYDDSSNTARIPVIEVPRDDDDDHSEDGYSDWGHSTQHSSDAFRSTAASDASFFSVNSDFTDSKSVFKEREF